VEEAERIFRYLAATATHGIRVPKVSQARDLEVYCDASRKKTGSLNAVSGVVVTFAGIPISWLSKRQTSVTTSIAEAELIALCAGVKEAIYFRRFLQEIGLSAGGATVIWEDNQSAVDFAARENNTEETKAYDHALLLIRQEQQRGTIIVRKIASQDNISDCLTKSLNRPEFVLLRERMSIYPPK
jgi:hypothetical protein